MTKKLAKSLLIETSSTTHCRSLRKRKAPINATSNAIKRNHSSKREQPEDLKTEVIQTLTKVTPFQQRVYYLISTIPRGKVSTYGAVAKQLVPPSGPRAVGNALRCNPFAPVVPCQRVIASDRKMGGFKGSNAPSGFCVQEKIAILKREGVVFEEDGKVDESSLHIWKC